MTRLALPGNCGLLDCNGFVNPPSANALEVNHPWDPKSDVNATDPIPMPHRLRNSRRLTNELGLADCFMRTYSDQVGWTNRRLLGFDSDLMLKSSGSHRPRITIFMRGLSLNSPPNETPADACKAAETSSGGWGPTVTQLLQKLPRFVTIGSLTGRVMNLSTDHRASHPFLQFRVLSIVTCASLVRDIGSLY